MYLFIYHFAHDLVLVIIILVVITIVIVLVRGVHSILIILLCCNSSLRWLEQIVFPPMLIGVDVEMGHATRYDTVPLFPRIPLEDQPRNGWWVLGIYRHPQENFLPRYFVSFIGLSYVRLSVGGVLPPNVTIIMSVPRIN